MICIIEYISMSCHANLVCVVSSHDAAEHVRKRLVKDYGPGQVLVTESKFHSDVELQGIAMYKLDQCLNHAIKQQNPDSTWGGAKSW